MRVTSAFSRLLDLPGVWVRSVDFEPDRVCVTVALRRRRLQCPKCSYCTRHRENKQHHDSTWRHLDLGSGASRSRARAAASYTVLSTASTSRAFPVRPRRRAAWRRDYDSLVAWLSTKTDSPPTCRPDDDRLADDRADRRACRRRRPSPRAGPSSSCSISRSTRSRRHQGPQLPDAGQQPPPPLRPPGTARTRGGQQAGSSFFAELDPPTTDRPVHGGAVVGAPPDDNGPVRRLPDRAPPTAARSDRLARARQGVEAASSRAPAGWGRSRWT